MDASGRVGVRGGGLCPRGFLGERDFARSGPRTGRSSWSKRGCRRGWGRSSRRRDAHPSDAALALQPSVELVPPFPLPASSSLGFGKRSREGTPRNPRSPGASCGSGNVREPQRFGAAQFQHLGELHLASTPRAPDSSPYLCPTPPPSLCLSESVLPGTLGPSWVVSVSRSPQTHARVQAGQTES